VVEWDIGWFFPITFSTIETGGRSPHIVSMVCKAGSFTPPVTVTTPVTTPAVKSLVKTELCSYFQNLGESLNEGYDIIRGMI
jgi:hypothetical protein